MWLLEASLCCLPPIPPLKPTQPEVQGFVDAVEAELEEAGTGQRGRGAGKLTLLESLREAGRASPSLQDTLGR
jgi:hypothetical protein